MTIPLNRTHDPSARSWEPSANVPRHDFPIQNLPFGTFRLLGHARVGVAIGDLVLDLASAADAGLFDGMAADSAAACRTGGMNEWLRLGLPHWSALRSAVFDLLDARHGQFAPRVRPHLHPIESVELLVPARIGDYTDFYASIFHATNVGRMMRPDHPLLPNYKYLPIGYHGRSSSIVVSGTRVRRPAGQSRPDGAEAPVFGPSRRLDYELEVGALVGPPTQLGQPVSLDRIEDHLFGLCLVNDWSARDVQAWEYQPLGPFLAKNFATTVSPWVVSLEALAPFRVRPFERRAGDPAPLPYLDAEWHRRLGGIDVHLEVRLRTAAMRRSGLEATVISASRLRDMYWTFAQMAAHHTSNGCNLQPGDLLASGTVSGPEKDSRGCLLELTWRGSDPLVLPSGESRAFLEDGDEVIFRGWCERDGAVRIGFGECRGEVLPASSDDRCG